MSRSSEVRDAWRNEAARGLLLDLQERGIEVSVRDGGLVVTPASLLTDDERAGLGFHKRALLVLVLASDDRTLDRLQARRRGRHADDTMRLPGRCHACGDWLPPARPQGRCGWCALAARLVAGGPLPESLIDLFPVAIAGAYARRGSARAWEVASDDAAVPTVPGLFASDEAGRTAASSLPAARIA